MNNPLIPEVLSPAGDMERLDAALTFGADAVYLAGEKFGMRAASANFTRDELAAAVNKTHALGKKLYVTCNILPRNHDLKELPDYFAFLDHVGVDALIISDFGVMEIAKRHAPHCALHISTQFGVVNHAAATFLHNLGASRVVLARELSMEEIREIRANTPKELELEAFVHGAICMSFSGRCVISNYLTGRDANHGECAQPCRWKYSVIEEMRPDQPMTLLEDNEGSYLFNANDMNMIEHIADLAKSGVASLKIEGRAKSAYYTAVTANAYRRAVDGYVASGYSSEYKPESWIVEELNKISHRPYGTGFYYGKPSQYLKAGGYIRSYEVAAVVEDWQDGWLKLGQRNRFFVGDTLDVLEPGGKPFDFTVSYMENDDRLPIESAPHPTMTVWIPYEKPLKKGTLFRFDKENGK